MGHYEVLGVRPDADAAEVRHAYLALARTHHPDRSGGDVERMRAVNEAWATLGDPAKRHQYDLARGHHAPQRPSRPTGWAAGPTGAPAPLADLDDDRPVRTTIVLPRWAAMLPVGLFAASVGSGLIGVLLNLRALLGVALMAFVLSSLLFLAAPFVALYAFAASNRWWGRQSPRLGSRPMSDQARTRVW